MRKLGAAVIGCGAISKNHGLALTQNDNAELRFCVDTDGTKADEFAKRWGCKTLSSHKDLLDRDDVDVVHVCTPHSTHPQIAIELLRRGKHVFCEKPLSIGIEDGIRVIEAANESGAYLGVCFQNRLNPATIEAKKILDAKKYGEITSAMALVTWDRHGSYYSASPWRGKYATEGGGCIINQSIHTLDLLDYLTGGVESLAAVSTKLRETDDYEVDDSNMANFRLRNGAAAVGYFTNCYPGSKQAQVEIVCENAKLTVSQAGLGIESGGQKSFIGNEVATGEKSEWGLSHGKLIREFYDCILGGRHFLVDGGSALRAVRIVDAIKRSGGKTIHIN